MSQANLFVSQITSPMPLTHSPVSMTHTPPTSVQTSLYPCVPGFKFSMKLMTINVKLFICVEKIMSRMSDNLFMMKDIDQSRFGHIEHGQDQVTVDEMQSV